MGLVPQVNCSTTKNSHPAKSDSKGTYSILSDGETDSETGDRNPESDGYDSDNEVLFLAKKGKGKNRNCFVRQEKGAWRRSNTDNPT